MIKFLLYLIMTVAIFPFGGHLAILTLLSTLLIVLFSYQILKGKIVLSTSSFSNNQYFILFMLIMFIYSVISIIWTVDIRGWLNYNIYLYIATISVIVSNYLFNTIADFYKLFKVLVSYSIVHNVIGWINVITGKYIFSTSPLIPDFREKGNPLSLFNNTNDLATYLVFAVFLNLIIIDYTNSRFKKIIYIVNIISSLGLIYASMSRANYLALLLGIIAYFFLQSTKKNLLYCITLIMTITGISVYSIPPIFRAINYFLNTKIFNSGDAVRVDLVKNGMSFLRESFGIGVGAGNIPYYLEHYSPINIGTTYSLHNWWLDILVTYGFFIFILYLIYYGKLLGKLYNLKNTTDKFIRNTSISFLSILFSYVIGSGSSSSNFPIMWLWIFFSIIIAFLNINYEEENYFHFSSTRRQ